MSWKRRAPYRTNQRREGGGTVPKRYETPEDMAHTYRGMYDDDVLNTRKGMIYTYEGTIKFPGWW